MPRACAEEQNVKRDTTTLVGASVLSAAGSLPLHLAPLIVALLVPAMGVVQAGLVATAVLAGQFVSAVALAARRWSDITRAQTMAVAAVLLLGLVLSSIVPLAGWFVVGLCCGGFQYLGTLTAALHSRPSFAFPIRLGVTLCLAGMAAGALQFQSLTYRELLVVLLIVFGIVLAIGIGLHQRTAPPTTTTGKSHGYLAYLSLAVVAVVFVGQSGLLAYVVQQATERGIVLQDAALAVAAMKLGAGLLLLALARRRFGFIPLVALLAGADYLVATATTLPLFVVALLGLEIGFNLLSAALQAHVASIAPQFGGRWLVAVILAGAATGPALHSFALRLEANEVFLAFAIGSALLPIALRKASAR